MIFERKLICNKQKTKMKLYKRILIGITATVLAVVLVLGVEVYAVRV